MGLFGFGEKETIYYPGCYSMAFLKDKIQNYRNILKTLGVDFSFREDSLCCGGCLIELGYEKNARKLARENISFLTGKKTKKIITNCPLCLQTFSQEYKKMLPDWDIKSEFIFRIILKKLKEDNDLVKYFSNEKVIYYDSCYLGRYLKIHDEPRELLKLFGYNVVEMYTTREETLCCGSCGQLDIINTELSKKIALNFLHVIQNNNIKKIITADPRAYHHLKEIIGSEKLNIQLIEFSEIICDALDIEKGDVEEI
jgi:Fe-S oxidoreductase